MGYVSTRTRREIDSTEATRLARDFIGAYNARDIDAMLATLDPRIVIYPTQLSRPVTRIAEYCAVRAWIETVKAEDPPYLVTVLEVQHVDGHRWVVRGEVLVDDELASPLVMIVRISDGRLLEVRSFLSDEDLLRELGVLP
jgi:hypothetical protein